MKVFSSYISVRKVLDKLSSSRRAKVSTRFFKTGKGEYGEGDIFIGITVPDVRKVAKQFYPVDFPVIKKLLKSEVHEYRGIAIEFLVLKYEKGSDADKKRVVNFYIKNIDYVNNWDLVDGSAPYILGDYLLHKNKKILYEFARSKNLWKRRVAIISTYGFIIKGFYQDTIKLSAILLKDKHDLIHKAVGWMLREVGKRSLNTELKFLNKYYRIMPRTMLRYAIEHFSQRKRLYYLKK